MKINRKYLYLFLSFAISSAFLVLIFLFNHMNGKEYLVIRGDYLDAIGFYKEFARSIRNHDSIYFNYTTGLGLNNIMLVSSLFTPFNLLYLIFYKANYDLLTAIILVLRVGLASAAFYLFSVRFIKNNNISAVFISVFYSLNAYAIAYGTILVSWLDAMIVLPLLCISIIECVEKNKRVNMILLYAYIYISHYYLGYMISGFSLIFIVLYLILIYKNNSRFNIKDNILKIINWALGVIISIMISAFVWVPTLFFIASNRVPDSTSVEEIKVSILQILNSLFWGMGYGIHGEYAYIYCGIPILILIPLFFLNKKIQNNIKWFFGILSGFILVSMASRQLNLIWHVFDQPDDFWYRYSFILCFCFCSIASYEIKEFDITEGKKLILDVLCLSLFYQLMLHTSNLWPVSQGIINTNYGFIINLVFLIVWSVIIYFVYAKNKYRIICLIFAFIIMSFELISGSKRQIDNPTAAYEYNAWNNSVQKVVNDIKGKDNGFYRAIITNSNTGYSSDTYFGINGISDFGNQEKYGVRKFLANMGFASSARVTSENGYNPVSEMLLGIKYEISAPNYLYRKRAIEVSSTLDEEDGSINDTFDNNDSSFYVTNPYALNIGYFVSGDILLYEYDGYNSFTNMNNIVSTMSGIDDPCFDIIPLDDASFNSSNIKLAEYDTGEFVFSRLDTSGRMEISVPKLNYNKAYLQFENEDPGIYEYDYFIVDAQNAPNVILNRLAEAFTIQMDSKDDRFISTIASFEEYSPEYFACDSINIAYLDEEALNKHFTELSKNQLDVVEFSNGHIEGKVHVEGNKRILFTTLPYDPGWKAFINGIEIEPIRVIDGTFIALLFPSDGDYNITLDYECPGLKIGILISICGIFALLSVIFEKKIKKKTIKE